MQALVFFDTKAFDQFLANGTELTPAKSEALNKLRETLRVTLDKKIDKKYDPDLTEIIKRCKY